MVLALSPLAGSSECAKEYRDARVLVLKESRSAYDACTKSVSDYHYWLDVAHCDKAGLGQSVDGGCQHFIAHRASPAKRNDEYCQELKVSTAEIHQNFERYLKKATTKKCVGSAAPSTLLHS